MLRKKTKVSQCTSETIDTNVCCTCFRTYDEDVLEETGADWIAVYVGGGHTKTVQKTVCKMILVMIASVLCVLIDLLCNGLFHIARHTTFLVHIYIEFIVHV